MNEIVKRSPAVTSMTFLKLLKEAGVNLPENVAQVIVESKAQDMVRVYYRCFADHETVNALVDVVMKVDREATSEELYPDSRAKALYAAYWRGTAGFIGEGWKDAWEMLSPEEKHGWEQAAKA